MVFLFISEEKYIPGIDTYFSNVKMSYIKQSKLKLNNKIYE